MLSSFLISFLPRNNCLSIYWLQSQSSVILEPKKVKFDTVSTFSPSICHKVMGIDGITLVFWMWCSKSAFTFPSFTLIKRLFSSSSFSAIQFSSVQFISVAQSCPTLCNPMNSSTPGPPVHHHLPEFIQTQVHRVGDAIQPSHPLLSPFPPAPNPSQHQSLFQ